MAFTVNVPVIGLMGITSSDTGVTPPNASSAIPTPPMTPGMIVRATDPTYGEGEFILLKGCANTVTGSVVRYNTVDFNTTLVADTAVQSSPVAVAMSASTSTSTWYWYQISGTATMAKITTAGGTVAANSAIYLSATIGSVKGASAAGKQILGARSQALSALSAATTVLVTINRPHLQGRIT